MVLSEIGILHLFAQRHGIARAGGVAQQDPVGGEVDVQRQAGAGQQAGVEVQGRFQSEDRAVFVGGEGLGEQALDLRAVGWVGKAVELALGGHADLVQLPEAAELLQHGAFT